MRCTFVASLAMAVSLLAGCATNAPRHVASRGKAAATQVTETVEVGTASRIASTPGSPRIKISLSDQRAYYLKGDTVVTSTRISTGKPGHDTPTGSFRVTQKELQHVSSKYGKVVDSSGSVVNGDADCSDSVPSGGRFVGAPMPYFMRFNGGIGMHAGYVPNYPASHGCVRLPRQMASVFYENTPVGTPVVVTN